MKRLIALLLVPILLLAGCAATVEDNIGTESTEKLAQKNQAKTEVSSMDFALALFRQAAGEETTLVSPLSVLTALAMTANGAEGETLAQMEAVLGGTREELNRWLQDFAGDEYLKQANGIWVKEDGKFTPEQAFVDTLQKWYDAQVTTAAFDDATLDEINGWVEEKTDGMIDRIIREIPEEAVMYLVNALAFDAAWAVPYTEHQVQEGIFTTEDGEAQSVEMMYDAVHNYLRTENAQGFLKWYEGQQYAFVALLPNEGVTVSQMLASLTGDALADLLAEPENTLVQTAIPKFESGSELELKGILSQMGMNMAFDGDLADLSGLGSYQDGNLCISKVLHKTHIEVAEQGTRAGAATAVEIAYATGAIGPKEEPTTVYLDRPFVYMIVDMEQEFPIFMGTCMEVER